MPNANQNCPLGGYYFPANLRLARSSVQTQGCTGERGVIKVGTLAKRRRLSFQDKQSIKEICRPAGLWRNTLQT